MGKSDKKIILIDATPLSDQYKFRGIGTYSHEVITRLVKFDGFIWKVLGFDDQKDNFKSCEFFSLGPVKLSAPINLLRFKRDFMPIIKQIKPDLYFAPYFERGLPIGYTRCAVFVHDVIPVLTNTYSKKGALFNFFKGKFYKHNLSQAKKANLVITNSNFSRSELVKAGFEENRIKVNYLGIKDIFLKDELEDDKRFTILQKYNIQKTFIYYWGGLEDNKNIPVLLEVFKRLKESVPEINLVLTDKNLFKEGDKIIASSKQAFNIKKIIDDHHYKKSIILTGLVEENELPSILDEATLFIQLSSYEGFGLTVSEALARGLPVIASNSSCFPELFSGSAVFVDPNNIEEIVTASKRVVCDDSLRNKLSIEGKKKILNYTWESHVRRLLDYFKEILE